MRFLTCLPQFSEKPQLKPPSNPVVLFMQNQVSPVCQSIFGLSLSLGGIIGSLCTPALANLAAPKSEDLSAPSRHISSHATATHLPSAASVDSEQSNVDVDYFDHGYESHQIAVEDHQQPKFFSSCGLAECDAGIAELISDPALAHIERADIGLVEKAQTLGLGVRPPGSTQNDSPDDFVSDVLNLPEIDAEPPLRAQVPDLRDSIPRERIIRDRTVVEGPPDEDLGELRLQLQRSRQNEDLGILRLLKTAEAAPPPPKQPVAFISGRLGFLDSDNVFRSDDLGTLDGESIPLSQRRLPTRRLDEQVYQAGLTVFLFPKLSDDTNFYAIAGTSLAAYGRDPQPNNNQLDLQLGVRQRLFSRTYAQLGWRNQNFYRSGYSKKFLGINSIEGQLSHRSILNNRTWIDGFYQARVSFADTQGRKDTVSKFRQTFTVSLNYGVSRDLRTSLLYQLDLDDFAKTSRYDTYHQVLASLSYKLTPEARLSLFGGTRFGRSSNPNVNLDDTFYGAGLNVTLPLF